MCLARPVKVLRCDGEWVEVDDGHGRHRAWAALLGDRGASPGDYLLVHGELAINRLPEQEALKILELIERLGGD